MDFSKLTEPELREFLSLAGNASGISKEELPKKAAELFENRQNLPNGLTFPVIDLYVATVYSGPRNVKYKLEDILKLNSNQIDQFAKFFQIRKGTEGTPTQAKDEFDKMRILRILRILGLLQDFSEASDPVWKNVFLSDPILKNLCSSLSFENLNNLRLALNKDTLLCPVDIFDPHGVIQSLPAVNDFYSQLYPQIEQGSMDAVIWAIDTNNFPALEELLKLGVSPNFTYVSDFPLVFTPLLWAISLGNEEAIRILLKYGADANYQVDVEGEIDQVNPLMQAVIYRSSENDPPKPRKFLVVPNPGDEEIEAYFNSGPPPAQIPGYEQIAQRRQEFEQKFETGELDDLFSDEYYQQIRKSASEKIIRMLGQLFAAGANPNNTDPLQDSVLGYYVGSTEIDADPQVIKYLVDHGAKLNQQVLGENTVLSTAIDIGNLKIIRLLLELGADPHFQDSTGRSVIEYVAEIDPEQYYRGGGLDELKALLAEFA